MAGRVPRLVHGGCTIGARRVESGASRLGRRLPQSPAELVFFLGLVRQAGFVGGRLRAAGTLRRRVPPSPLLDEAVGITCRPLSFCARLIFRLLGFVLKLCWTCHSIALNFPA